jgi:uncharacterized membrane protein YdfJ with MMPL/SSD domain
MDRLARLATAHPGRVVAVTVAFAVVAAVLGLGVPARLGRASNDFLPGDAQSVRAENAVESASRLSAAPQLLVLVRRPTQARLARVAALVRAEPAFPALAPPLFSRDRGEAIVSAYARGGVSQQRWRKAAERVDRAMQRVPGTAVGGSAIAVVQVNRQVQRDLTRAEALAFPALFVIALFVFGSVVAALLPLVVGGLTILAALLLLRVLDAITPVSPYALNIVTGAGLGLAIDYSLLLVSRYREERGNADAIRTTLRTAGRTIAFSSVTVGAAVATLAVFPLGFLRSMGIAGGLVGPLAGLIALTVLPALFALLGPRIDALSVRRRQPAGGPAREGGWYRLAHAIMRRPVPVAVAAATLLVVLGIPFLSMRFTGIDAGVLPPGASARVVDTALRQDFAPAFTSPAFAVVRGDRAAARRFAEAVRGLPGAARVRPPRRLGPSVWEVEASSGSTFLSDRSRRLVEGMRGLAGGALVGGATAQFLDQKHSIGSRLPLALLLLCVVTYALLYLATRSVLLPLKTLVMNFLTLAATFGVLVFVFQDGRLEGPLDYRGQGALQLTLPVLLFAIAFGLATDYGVFLLTRIKEGWDSGLPNREAVAVGLERTGRIVTAAALLFCIAVGAFATSGVVLVKEVGVGIALAVAIDASVVRVFLVPSLMAILGRWNWFPAKNPARSARHDDFSRLEE